MKAEKNRSLRIDMDVEKIKKYISELKEENPFISQVDLAYQVFLKSIIADAIPRKSIRNILQLSSK